ncbi:transmembrane inner ear expressed protein [Copidosoma floridanum]|uniref:transmembrane inner ear expressed protein n=1 Tax=Copidosoma floridanum TaxID=29053 RepID=UPI0006C9E33F|nr:transmembrane inner ear expressed protein [Copidosoma floridanum]
MDILDQDADNNGTYMPIVSSPSPSCLDSNANITDCLTEEVKEWLENEVVGMRVWQLVGITLFAVLAAMIMLCCCLRFRIPRTKQEIEADFIRKSLARLFRKFLDKVPDKEMDGMDLRKALLGVLDMLNAEGRDESSESEDKRAMYEGSHKGFGAKLNAIFHCMKIHYDRDESEAFNTMI